jgi:hypothetical protein
MLAEIGKENLEKLGEFLAQDGGQKPVDEVGDMLAETGSQRFEDANLEAMAGMLAQLDATDYLKVQGYLAQTMA